MKDLFDVVGAGKLDETKLEDLIRKPVLFVAETQPALSVLREMRSKRLHLAIVTDEFGGTGGIVTLEDIIEEIVGEIRDEYDTEEVAQIQKLAEGRFVADAAIPLGDLEIHLGQKLPEDGDFESLGGLIVHRAGRVPEVGATVSLDGYDLIVREADETRVVKVEIVRAEPRARDRRAERGSGSDRRSDGPAPAAARTVTASTQSQAPRVPFGLHEWSRGAVARRRFGARGDRRIARRSPRAPRSGIARARRRGRGARCADARRVARRALARGRRGSRRRARASARSSRAATSRIAAAGEGGDDLVWGYDAASLDHA